jgi:OmpA-OmpF porin, OOP family
MMNKKMLCAALLGALGLSQAATAQDYYDGRWYMTIGPQFLQADGKRDVKNTWGGTMGVGRYFSPNFTMDMELYHALPHKEENRHLNWSLYGVGFVGRWHFLAPDRNWSPFVSAGIGLQRHEEEFSDPLGGRPFKRKGNELMAQLGVGMQANITDRFGIRLDAALRSDQDDRSGRNVSRFNDRVYSANFMWKFGDPPRAVVVEERAPPPPPPPAPAPEPQVERCPPPRPGQAVGPDGCPIPLTIDLRGVNFDFDKATLRPDAVQILQEAVDILRKYPDLRVEVAGHTDSIGTEQYNQGLSERRARTVYDYLTNNGISSNRLVGPTGYGESRPIAPNANPDGSDNPEGRARNRRTELNVQN